MTFWDTFWKEATENDKRDFLISLVVIVLAGAFILNYVMPNNESEYVAGNEQLHTPAVLLSDSDTLIVEGAVYEMVEEEETPIVVAKNAGNAKTIDRKSKEKNSAIVLDTIKEELEIIEEKSLMNSSIETVETEKPLENAQMQNNLSESNLKDTFLIVDTISEIEMDSNSIATEESTPTEEESDTEEELVIEEKADIEEDLDTEKESALKQNNQEKEEVKDNSSTKKSSTINKDCVILIGAYTDVKNATKMRQNLEKAGFDVFVTSNKKFTNIGIYSSCESSLLNKNLKNIRTNFAKDAVILKKK